MSKIKFNEMTPKEIVAELDKYIIGQDKAKKSVAIALRNRYRRSKLSEEMRDEVSPKNILMMGPTGVGKTEIARRLAKLMEAPFIKVEATKFTEVGYVGRDVDSMVRDLVEASIRLTKQKKLEAQYSIAEKIAEEKILEAIIPGRNKKKDDNAGKNSMNPFEFIMNGQIPPQFLGGQTGQNVSEENDDEKAEQEDVVLAREQVRQQLHEGLLEDHFIEIEIVDTNKTGTIEMGGEPVSISLGSIFGDTVPEKTKKKKVTVREAKKILREQEAQKLIDMDQVTSEALENAEQNGIIFIDEIDKIASGSSYKMGADVSREGVQRDILPIVEGSVINTKYGPVKTDHVLFIGAGAFHVSKPTDLIPELQGRFPIRVELENLDEEAFHMILTVPENALLKQHKLLLETEGTNIHFTEDAAREIAKMAYLQNEQQENIGARRLHTIMEKLLEDIAFELPDPEKREITIDCEYVKEKFIDTIKQRDLDKFIL